MSIPERPLPHRESEVQFEPRDVAWKIVIYLTGITLVIVVVMALAAEGLHRALHESSDEERIRRSSSLEVHAATPAPLQSTRPSEDQRLRTYGWVSQSENIVRIPIHQAMQLWIKEQAP